MAFWVRRYKISVPEVQKVHRIRIVSNIGMKVGNFDSNDCKMQGVRTKEKSHKFTQKDQVVLNT